MMQKIRSKTAKSVAAILEQELGFMIKEWIRRASMVPSLTTILLSDTDRAGHLPKLFDGIVGRLLGNRDTEPPGFYLRRRAWQVKVRAGLLCRYVG
jgi:hypothetical protein